MPGGVTGKAREGLPMSIYSGTQSGAQPAHTGSSSHFLLFFLCPIARLFSVEFEILF